MLKPTERFEILVRTNHLKPEMMRPLIKVTLYDATSENDFTLLEEKGEYFVSFADRTGTYREFLRMILLDDRLYPDLVAGDAAASFFVLMKAEHPVWQTGREPRPTYCLPRRARRRALEFGDCNSDPKSVHFIREPGRKRIIDEQRSILFRSDAAFHRIHEATASLHDLPPGHHCAPLDQCNGGRAGRRKKNGHSHATVSRHS